MAAILEKSPIIGVKNNVQVTLEECFDASGNIKKDIIHTTQKLQHLLKEHASLDTSYFQSGENTILYTNSSENSIESIGTLTTATSVHNRSLISHILELVEKSE